MHKVLLIEDDATMLSLLQTLLEIEGFQVILQRSEINPASVLKTVRRERPDLILMDVHLQHTSGFDLLDSIRRDHELARTRVIMSSGMELSARCREAGADDFILKPYMPDELLEKINAIIGVKG